MAGQESRLTLSFQWGQFIPHRSSGYSKSYTEDLPLENKKPKKPKKLYKVSLKSIYVIKLVQFKCSSLI